MEEAARVLRIGRSAAYNQARLWRETGGQVGLPNIAVGGSYRVPLSQLAATIGRPITHIPDATRHRPRPDAPDPRRDIAAAASAERGGAGSPKAGRAR